MRTLLLGLLMALGSPACSGLPSMDQQRQLVHQNDLRINQITPRALMEEWGKPTYVHQQFTQFFVMKDGSLIPQSRLSLGESPQGWETGLEAGEALFLAYPERSWYLVFFDDRLVYRESMDPARIHSIGKAWKYEEQFRTRLESPLDSGR